jgi:hypothetical protein
VSVCHDYYTFLRERLPELARRRLPFYRRTRKSKHDTLRHVLRSTRLQPEDLVAEFGVYRATTLRMIARALPRHRLYGFDSFEGFPDNEMKAFYEYLLESDRDFAWLATRGRVMMLDAFLQERSLGRLPATMKEWRAQGYEQEVALRLV